MGAFIDAVCGKCGRKISWVGGPANRPACRHCGHRPPQAELDAAQEKLDAHFKSVATPAEQESGEQLRDSRIRAGLSLRQACYLLNISGTRLSNIERGDEKPTPELAQAMNVAYGKDAGAEERRAAPR